MSGDRYDRNEVRNLQIAAPSICYASVTPHQSHIDHLDFCAIGLNLFAIIHCHLPPLSQSK